MFWFITLLLNIVGSGDKFLCGFTLSEVASAARSSAAILDVLNVLFNGGDVCEEERD